MRTTRSILKTVAIATATIVLALGGAVGVAGVAHADLQPITISPSAAAPGSSITVSGAGCNGSGYIVRGTAGTESLPDTIVEDEENGQWSFTYVVPANTPVGALDINLVCLDFDSQYWFTYPTASETVALAPLTEALSSTGKSPAAQSVVVSKADNAVLSLLSGGNIVPSVSIVGQGVYTTDGASTLIFTPEAGFVGTPTPANYRVTDLSTLTSDNTYSPTVTAADILPPINVALRLDLVIGDVVEGAPYVISGSGLLPHSEYTVTLHSTPTVLLRAIVDDSGAFTGSLVLPAGVEAGQHTLTLDGIGYDGVARSSVAYITVGTNGRALYVSSVVADKPTLPNTGFDAQPAALLALLLLSAGVALRVRRSRPTA